MFVLAISTAEVQTGMLVRRHHPAIDARNDGGCIAEDHQDGDGG